MEIDWQPRYAYVPKGEDEDERGEITDQSSPSRKRAGFAFGNAEVTWLCMILLTWPSAPKAEDVKRAVRKLRRLWQERWGESMDAWLMEMHLSGVPHFHLFVAAESEFGKACAEAPKRHIRRKKKNTIVVGGVVERWLVGAWLECIDELGNEKALAFNRGGIIEMVRSHDAAGRYVAKECCKRAQKVLPEMYRSGLGRWWWLNPRWARKCIEEGFVDHEKYPFEGPLKHVWQHADIEGALRPGTPTAVETPSRPGRLYVLKRASACEPLRVFAKAVGARVVASRVEPQLLLRGLSRPGRVLLPPSIETSLR